MDTVHSSRAQRRRGAPPAGQRLTRDDVIAQATGLISRDGLAGFSLRGLADALGVAPNALYNHVRDRADLLDTVTDRFVARIALPAGDEPWPGWLRAAAAGLRAQLTEHPGLTELMLARAGATVTGPQLLGRFQQHLVSAGLDPAVAHVAWHAVLTTVVGTVVQERAGGRGDDRAFEAVLDVTMSGLLDAADRAPAPQAVALLAAHAPREVHSPGAAG